MKTQSPRQPKDIWVVEDDRIYREVLCYGLQESIPGVKIRYFPSEGRVYLALKEVERGQAPPDLVICDVMLPWKFPGEDDMEDPSKEIQDLGDGAFRDAGVRLWKRFRSSTTVQLKNVPFIYHSVLRKKTMNFDGNKDSSTYYVGKDQTFDELLEVKEEIFAQLDSHWDGSDEEESIALEQSPKMKQRLVDALATPLTHCFSALE